MTGPLQEHTDGLGRIRRWLTEIEADMVEIYGEHPEGRYVENILHEANGKLEKAHRILKDLQNKTGG